MSAVLDWELSTLGDPLLDLAYCCMPYHAPKDLQFVFPAIVCGELYQLLMLRVDIQPKTFFLKLSFFTDKL